MKVNDMMKIVREKYPVERCEEELHVNVDGFILPVENVKFQDGKLVIIVSASSIEERDL
jgi:hypothetical protein